MFIFQCLKVKVEPKRPSRLHFSVIRVNCTVFFVVCTLYNCIKNISYIHLPQCYLVPDISYQSPNEKSACFIPYLEEMEKLDAAINFVHEVYSSVNWRDAEVVPQFCSSVSFIVSRERLFIILLCRNK